MVVFKNFSGDTDSSDVHVIAKQITVYKQILKHGGTLIVQCELGQVCQIFWAMTDLISIFSGKIYSILKGFYR